MSYQSKVLSILADISGVSPSSAPVISIDEFHAAVLKMLCVIAGEDSAEHRNYYAEVLRLLAAIGATIPDDVVNSRYKWYAAVLRMLSELTGGEIVTPPAVGVDRFHSAVLTMLPNLSGGKWTTISGVSPLMLPNALAKAIASLIQFGKITQSGTPTPSTPVAIVCNNGAIKWDSVNQRVYTDGTPEVLNVVGKNLLNTAKNTTGYFINASGVISADDGTPKSQYTELISVTAGEKYTWSLKSYRSVSGNDRLHGYNANGTWVQQLGYDSAGTGGAAFSVTVTIPNGVAYVRCSYGIDDTESMLEHGETKTDYEAFSAQTASVADLYAVGDVTDEQNIIRGAVTQRISCHVFDGTETFSKSTAYGKAFLINAASAAWGADRTQEVLCTHFLGLPQTKSTQDDNTCFFNQTGHFYFRVTDNSDADAFKTWLAEQYASGNPVIVFFVLSESTTESVAAQPLTTGEGNNTISVTANVTVTLEAEYISTT